MIIDFNSEDILYRVNCKLIRGGEHKINLKINNIIKNIDKDYEITNRNISDFS